MSWEKAVALLAGLVIGISAPVGLGNTPVGSGVVTAKAADTEQGYSGTLGINCTWHLSADSKTLTIAGGDGGGTLPSGKIPEIGDNGGVIAEIIRDEISKQMQVNWTNILANVVQIELKGNLKTEPDASYLFAELGEPGSATIDLGNLDTSDTTNMSHMFDKMQVTCLDLKADKNFKTSNVTNMAGMFADCTASTIDVSSFDTSKVTDMSDMFRGLNLTKLDVSNFDTSKVTDISRMFSFQKKLETIDINNFDTSNVTNMSGIFYMTSSLTHEILNFDTSKVTDMSGMFENNSGDTKLTTIEFGKKFKTSNVKDMSQMFSGDSELKTVNTSALDTSSVTNMREMFRNVSSIDSLDLSNFKTSEVEDMSWMFGGMNSLSKLDVSSFNTGNVQVFSRMFTNDPQLTQLDLENFHTDQAVGSPEKGNPGQGVSGMFSGDTGLTKLDIRNFKMVSDSVNDEYTFTEYMFDQDSQLSKLVLGNGARFQNDVQSEFKQEPGYSDEFFEVHLPNITKSAEYTGAWQAVGTGTDDDPQGAVYGSSDKLVQAYEGDDRPSGVQTYVWQPVNRPAKPVNPVTPTTPKPTTPTPVPDEPDEVFTGSSLNAIKKIGFYRQPTFTKKNRITWFAKAPRTRQPQFVVIGKATSRHGVARYQVRDVNRQSPTYKKTGYITTRTAYVEPTYVAKTSRAKTITVINPRGINGYGKVNLTQKHKHYRQGQQLKVKRIVTHNLTTRFQLTNGQYVTANRQWIQTGKRQYPRQITTKHTIWRYRDVNFRKQTHHYRKHQRLQVRGWDYSDHGTLRYRVTGGYVTANARWVQAVKS